MATETELMPVRETLNKQFGIDDKRIGYNPNTGYVTIDNQNVLKPPVNQAGTTYAGQDVFNSATGQINTLNNAYNLQQQVLNPQQQANPYDQQITQLMQQLSAPRQQVNPVDAQFNQVMQQLMQRTQNPTVIDRNTAYASPQYEAAQAQTQRGAQQATRQAQEALGAARLGRSSVLADRAQIIQNEANQYLETQTLPQIIAQLQAQEDAQTRNLYNLLGALGQQQSLYDTRMNQEDARLYNFLNALTQQQGLHDTRGSQQYDRAAQVLDFLTGQQNRAQDVDFRNRQFEYGQQQDQRDFDYRQQQDQLAQQNLEDERAYRSARDQIADEQYKQKFDEDVRRFGLTYAMDQARLANQINQQNIDNAMSRERLDFDKEQASRPKETQPSQTQQNNAFVAEVTSNLDRIPIDKRVQFFRDERETLINQLGINGYNQLYNLYFNSDGSPK